MHNNERLTILYGAIAKGSFVCLSVMPWLYVLLFITLFVYYYYYRRRR